jgi:hypothetical protein
LKTPLIINVMSEGFVFGVVIWCFVNFVEMS